MACFEHDFENIKCIKAHLEVVNVETTGRDWARLGTGYSKQGFDKGSHLVLGGQEVAPECHLVYLFEETDKEPLEIGAFHDLRLKSASAASLSSRESVFFKGYRSDIFEDF
jgi:hypothetical protein